MGTVSVKWKAPNPVNGRERTRERRLSRARAKGVDKRRTSTRWNRASKLLGYVEDVLVAHDDDPPPVHKISQSAVC